MHDQGEMLTMVPIGTVHTVPTLHLRFTRLLEGLCLQDFSTAWISRLTRGQAFLRLTQGLAGWSQTPPEGQRITLDQVLEEVEPIGDAQAIQTGFGPCDARRGPVTHQVNHPPLSASSRALTRVCQGP